MGRGAWRATVHGVTKSWTRLSTQALWYYSIYFCCLLHLGSLNSLNSKTFWLKWKWSRSVAADFLRPHGLLTRLLHSRDFLGDSIGVVCHFRLQRSPQKRNISNKKYFMVWSLKMYSQCRWWSIKHLCLL